MVMVSIGASWGNPDFCEFPQRTLSSVPKGFFRMVETKDAMFSTMTVVS